MVNYAVSDMITRIRNGLRAKKTKVSIISTQFTRNIATILKREGYIDFDSESLQGIESISNKEGLATNVSVPLFEISLKYTKNKNGTGSQSRSVLTNVKCVSRPGGRIYANARKIPQVLGGLGITILSTSKGILTDYEARKLSVGGEILCILW